MATQPNRMQFLRGDFSAEGAFRPPWAIMEQAFTDTCDRCDACIKACPPKLLQRGNAGFPEISFQRNGCDFCEACARSCPTQALHITTENHYQPWQLVAKFKRNCLSENGVVCRSCGDVCEGRAIKFKMIVGGSALVQMDASLCNGCGECVSVCPVQAIEMKHIKPFSDSSGDSK
jgi:ferredoxin-type protein NapF